MTLVLQWLDGAEEMLKKIGSNGDGSGSSHSSVAEERFVCHLNYFFDSVTSSGSERDVEAVLGSS